MISFDEAIRLISAIARPLGTDRIPLSEASGAILAEPVRARLDAPRADVSAMDGFAVRDSDLETLPTRLRVVGESFAGAGWSGTVSPGECARIFTGAPVPQGCDRVVMQEDVQRDGEFACFAHHPADARYIRGRGSDFVEGDEVLPRGRFLDARAVIAAAAADVGVVEIHRRPRVRILSTGDELAEPGTARSLRDGVPDSVSLGISALVREWGRKAAGTTRLRDELGAMRAAAGEAVDGADVIVVTGGASVGERDYAKAMFEPLGLDLIFSKVAIKPGKPAWLGRVRNRLVVGLPGNPSSAFVTARLFLVPLLGALQSRPVADTLNWKSAILGGAVPACGDRETFHRAVARNGIAEILSFQESSAQKALAEANALIRQRANSRALGVGDEVEILEL